MIGLGILSGTMTVSELLASSWYDGSVAGYTSCFVKCRAICAPGWFGATILLVSRGSGRMRPGLAVTRRDLVFGLVTSAFVVVTTVLEFVLAGAAALFSLPALSRFH